MPGIVEELTLRIVLSLTQVAGLIELSRWLDKTQYRSVFTLIMSYLYTKIKQLKHLYQFSS